MHNSRHIGMLAYHSMMALEHDMIGLTMTAGNSLSSVPTHGAEKRFATNPWAYAVPADKEPPFVFDIATTQVKFSDTTNITISSGSTKKLRKQLKITKSL